MFSDSIEQALNSYRDIRDSMQESTFKFMYDNPFIEAFFSGNPDSEAQAKKKKRVRARIRKTDRQQWLDKMQESGFPKAAIRIMLAVPNADKIVDEDEMKAVDEYIGSHKKFNKLSNDEIKRIMVEQSRILQTDLNQALSTLSMLLLTGYPSTRAGCQRRRSARYKSHWGSELLPLLFCFETVGNRTLCPCWGSFVRSRSWAVCRVERAAEMYVYIQLFIQS